MKLRRLSGTAGRSSVSKSLIVEKAIQMALKELERKGDKSRIASMTVNRHRQLNSELVAAGLCNFCWREPYEWQGERLYRAAGLEVVVRIFAH